MSGKESAKFPKHVKERSEEYQELEQHEQQPFIEARYETINNIRYELQPSPTIRHQTLVLRLAQALSATCHPNGVILIAPVDVYLSEANIFQPDVIFISNENQEMIKEERIEGAPNLVAEVLSPSTSKNDKIYKKHEYERFGVREYWVVDPIHLTVDQFVLIEQKFQFHTTYGDEDNLISEQFPCISIDLKLLFEKLD